MILSTVASLVKSTARTQDSQMLLLSRSYHSKLFRTADEAIADVRSGQVLLCGGFGLCGVPNTLLHALERKGKEQVLNLTCVSNNAGLKEHGLGRLLGKGQIQRMVSSFIGGNTQFEQMYLQGQVELEMVPQGTLAERIRAGAAGIPAFFTPTGADIDTSQLPLKYKARGPVSAKETPIIEKLLPVPFLQTFFGRPHKLEAAIYGDVAFIRAYKADKLGNLVFRKSANNFNAVMAKNAKMTIVEAEEIVEIGDLDPACIHVPSIYVDRIIQSKPERLPIEKVTLKAPTTNSDSVPDAKKTTICRRAAQLLNDGEYVNLGIGMPMAVPDFLDPSKSIYIQSENGLLGMGEYPSSQDQVDADLINAGKETVTLSVGGSYFDSAESFAMIRGGHLDCSMLGVMQVSAVGDLANFIIPNRLIKGMGGAADLVASPDQTRIIALTEHNARDGSPKIVETCTLPLTGARCVSMIVTELATFEVDRRAQGSGLTLVELAPGVSLEEVTQRTGATFQVQIPS
ncbi:hypothetical protein CBS101457_002949 [Exobasidium rhododendri]|nr:hypothetical protein CBS101457_002949 [Exobasidium rhododendri]